MRDRVFMTSPHRQPDAVFGGFTSTPRGWMLLCKEFVTEDSAHLTMQRMTTVSVTLVFLLVSVSL